MTRTRTKLAILIAAFADAEREHLEAMKAHRGWAARNRERITAEWDALPGIPRTMEEYIAAVPKERRDELNAEWSDRND